MAATNFTPIQLYYSATPAAVPTAPNLVAGELALNTNDGKLYYKNSSSVVTLLASATTVTNSFSAGTTGLTPNTATTGAVTLAGTLAVANGGTGITSFGTGVATALGVNTGSAGAFVVNGGALGSPSSVGTMPAFTLGGTVSGGGNNINNVVIGASGALAGSFTTLSATGTATLGTGLASYALGGGSAAAAGLTDKDVTLRAWSVTSGTNEYSGDLILQSGVGAGNTSGKEGSVIIKAGNSGATPTTLGALTTIGTFSSTGLAVTGTLSTTGNISMGTNPAVSTGINLPNNTGVNGRNAGNTSDITMIAINSGNKVSIDPNSVGAVFGSGLAGGTSGTGYSFSGSAPATSLTLDSSGNLGLGVTPSAWNTAFKALELKNSAGFLCDGDTAFVTNNCYFNSSNSWIYKATDFATRYQQQSGTNKWFIAPSGIAGDPITFTQAMTLDASGNLGIGTSSPSSFTTGGTPILVVGNNAQTQITLYGGSSVGDINFATSSSGVGLYSGVVRYDGTSNFMSFWTNSAERARIDSSGNLLVGTTTTNPGSGNTTTGNYLGAIGVASFSRASDASLTINTNTDSKVCRIYRSGTEVGDITVTTTTTSFNSTSDYRLKTVHGAVSDSGSRIDSLKPVEYTWNSNGLRTRGFLAHQFQEVYAGSVNGTKDAVDAEGKPEYQSMQASTSEVIADLVAELQSLRARVAQLESKP